MANFPAGDDVTQFETRERPLNSMGSHGSLCCLWDFFDSQKGSSIDEEK